MTNTITINRLALMIDPPLVINRGMVASIADRTIKAGINKTSDYYTPLKIYPI